MLHRLVAGELLGVGQPAHALLAGALARAWAEPFDPREAVCLAAEQHDLGWTDWELEPELDPATGLPYTFGDLPAPRRLALWAGAAERLVPQSRYAALLVSLHGTLLVERFPPAQEHAAAAAAFLARERAFQEGLRASLGPDAVELARNRELVFTWDALSLALVHGVAGERKAAGYTLAPGDGDAAPVFVRPWPFRETELEVAFEGRVLGGPFADEEALRAALAAAPWVTVETTLRPG
jgi:hypothetical protein